MSLEFVRTQHNKQEIEDLRSQVNQLKRRLEVLESQFQTQAQVPTTTSSQVLTSQMPTQYSYQTPVPSIYQPGHEFGTQGPTRNNISSKDLQMDEARKYWYHWRNCQSQA